MFSKTIGKWLWPVFCGLLLISAFAVRGSDTAAPSLILMAAVAGLAGLAWAFPVREAPGLSKRPEFLRLVAAAAILALYLAVQPFILMLTQRNGLVHGLYDPSRATLEALKLAGIACAFMLGFRVSINDDNAARVLDAIIMTGAIWAAVAIVLHLMDADGIYGVAKINGQGRLTGAFSSANSAGTLFGAISLMALGRVIDRFWKIRARHIIERIDPMFLTAWVLSFMALILTLSRMGIATTVFLSLVLLIALCWRRTPVKWLVPGVGAACLVLVGILMSPLAKILDRGRHLNNDSHARAVIFSEHLHVSMHQPWFGSGLGSFNAVNHSITTELNYSYLSIIRALHNVYLQWLEECGVIGLIALAAVNIVLLLTIFSAARQRQSMGNRLWIVLGAYAVFLIHGLTDYAFQEPALEIFTALLLGCGFAIATNSGRTRANG